MNAVMQVAAQAVCTLRAVGAIVLRPSGSQSGEARARREEVRPMQREVKRIIFQSLVLACRKSVYVTVLEDLGV
jgi:hypothetical protein